ncbi:hypothetical protein Bca101_077379 [Brassica carinata]
MRTEEKEKWRSESVYKLLMIVLPYLHSLYELIVTGCTELVPEGIIACVETLTKNNHKLETLHINGAIDLSALSTYLPQEGAIDLEVCPKCDQVRIIPPCSRETCARKHKSAGDAGIASLDAWSVQCVSAQTLRLKKQRVGETLCVLLVAKRFQSAGSATNPTAQVTAACDKVTQRRTRLCLHAKLVTTGQEQAQAILSF